VRKLSAITNATSQYDISKAYDNSTCATGETLCADGSCVPAGSYCAPVAACPPDYPLRCPDSSCVTNSTACSTLPACEANSKRCADGSCRIGACPAFDGCPASAPVRCETSASCEAVSALQKCLNDYLTAVANAQSSSGSTSPSTVAQVHHPIFSTLSVSSQGQSAASPLVEQAVVQPGERSLPLGCTFNCLRNRKALTVVSTINAQTNPDTQQVVIATDADGAWATRFQVYAGAILPKNANGSYTLTLGANPVADSVVQSSTVDVIKSRQGTFGTASLDYASGVLSSPFTCSADSGAIDPYPIPIVVQSAIDRMVPQTNDLSDACFAYLEPTSNKWQCIAGTTRAERLASPSWSPNANLGRRTVQGRISSCWNKDANGNPLSSRVFAFVLNPIEPPPKKDGSDFIKENLGAIVGTCTLCMRVDV